MFLAAARGISFLVTEPKPGLERQLQEWHARQRRDGLLAGCAVILAAMPVANFLLNPSPGSACVMILFILIMSVVCVRLLLGAARAARIEHTLHPVRARRREVIDVEVLDNDGPRQSHRVDTWVR